MKITTTLIPGAVAATLLLLTLPNLPADPPADSAPASTPSVNSGTGKKGGTNELQPTMGTVQPDFWHQQYLLGDWGGTRTRLANEGITFDFNNIGDFQADVTGSQTHHAAYFGRFRASADVDFKKLADFDGEFFVTGIWQYGRNLSGDYLGVNTLTSSIAGEESERIDQLWYQQGLFDSKLKIKLGQVAAVNEFGATDFFDILFNDELGYAPNAIFNTKQPFSPAGKPGIIFTGDLSDITPGLYVKTGVFTGYDNPYRPDSNGIYYHDDFQHGITGSTEVGYKEQNTQYDGVYKVGVNWNSGYAYQNPSTGQNYGHDYNIYATVEKTVYHPYKLVDTDTKEMKDAKDMKSTRQEEMLDTKRGLDLLFEVVGEPGDRNPLDYEFTMGARYTGLFDCRPQDKIGFGLIYSDNGNAYSDAYQTATGRGGLGGETTVELDYQYNPTPWLSIQPDAQYILDPGGDSSRSDILVLGLRTIVRF
jgi:porin